MRLLDLDTQVSETTQSHGERKNSRVLHDYWTAEYIQQQMNRLNTQISVFSGKEITDKEGIHAVKAMNLFIYIRADLDEIMKSCKDLTIDRKQDC